MQSESLFWIWLSERLGAQSRDFRKLISLYESPYDLFHAESEELERVEGISERTKAVLSDKDLQGASKILEDCQRLGIGLLPYGDDAYPHLLRDLKDPPILLYYRGTLPDFHTHLCIGIVGTRRMSAYGLKTAYKIAYELASAEAIVVSGMASGIDGVAASASLLAGGCTAAVLGCGLDIVYPKHHEVLMQEIERHGVLLSEYPPGTKPSHYHFPVRNRIISGLSQGLVVVEAGMRSGSLITAKTAVMQGRDLFAVPANVGSVGAEGTNGLLRDGANLVLETDDVLERYRYIYADALHLEAYQAAKKRSRADLHALERYGVIELTASAQETAEGVRAAAVPAESERMPHKSSGKKRPVRKQADAPAREAPTNAEAPAGLSKTPDEVLSSLSPVQLAILQAMPDDRPVTVDSLGGLGYPYGDLIAAFTMLEILGLVRKLPGALYTKV